MGRKKIQAKIKNKGIPCLYLGHADNHGSDVCRLLKLETKRVVRSRDLKWLDKTLKEYMKDKGDFEVDSDDNNIDSDEAFDFEDDDDEAREEAREESSDEE